MVDRIKTDQGDRQFVRDPSSQCRLPGERNSAHRVNLEHTMPSTRKGASVQCRFAALHPTVQRFSILFFSITSAHLAMSALKKVARASGELGSATMPRPRSFSLSAGSASTSAVALLSCATISGGLPALTNRPFPAVV